MDDRSWRKLEGTWDRLVWARGRTPFDTATAAAESLGMRPNTYSAYERPPHASKHIALGHQAAAKIAKKFKVRWEWLLTGEGEPWLADRDDPPDTPPSPTLRVVVSMKEASEARQEAIATFVEALVKEDKGA